MAMLMIDAGSVAADAQATRTGGVPLAPPGTEWPRCASCDGPMQFLAQIVLGDLGEDSASASFQRGGLLALFACQNDPGMCDDWSPVAGGNRALLFPLGGLRPLSLPEVDAEVGEDVLVLGAVHGVACEAVGASDYDSAREDWAKQSGLAASKVIGQLGGVPSWIQGDETPSCSSCENPMSLVAQLEEGPEHSTAMNFGSGSVYAFACQPCARAAFLWQC
jgi:hypothetical protein